MPITGADFVIDVIIALLGGVLIGLERERAQIKPSSSSVKASTMPGMRSFGLLSVYGAITAYISKYFASSINGGEVLLPIAFLSLMLIILIHAYARMVRQRVLGITTYLVMFIAFIVGFLAGLGLHLESASLSVIVTLVLALKYPAERLAAEISYNEMLAMLEVAAISLVIGPIVYSYASQSGFEILYKVYVFFAVVLLLSFVSYAAAKIWGGKGLLYAAGLGSLVNSEATIGGVTSLIGELEDEQTRREYLSTAVRIILAVLQIRAVALVIIALYIFTGWVEYEAVVATLVLVLIHFAISMGPVRQVAEKSKAVFNVKSPLSWSLAIKSALAYLLLTVTFQLIGEFQGLLPLSIAILGVSALGGLVNATATILSLATVYGNLPSNLVLSGMFLSIATASLNKILYADTSKLSQDELKLIMKWSIIESLFPFVLSTIIYIYI